MLHPWHTHNLLPPFNNQVVAFGLANSVYGVRMQTFVSIVTNTFIHLADFV